MARLTITEAIKRSPVGKSQFYAKYVDEGLITISVDGRDKKYVDSSELFRVFGTLDTGQSESVQVESRPDVTGVNNSEQSELIGLLKEQLAESKKQVTELKAETSERENYYRSQITALTNRLEAPAPTEPAKRQSRLSRWWYGLDDD